MIHNINVYRSTGEPTRVRVFAYSPDEACNLPDGSQILHSQAFYDDSGDYIQLWVAVPEASEIMRTTQRLEAHPASDEGDTLRGQELDIDDTEPIDDEAFFKA